MCSQGYMPKTLCASQAKWHQGFVPEKRISLIIVIYVWDQ